MPCALMLLNLRSLKMKIRTYFELTAYSTFLERFRYLSLRGVVGDETFGHDRYMNQMFYRSSEWKSLRSQIIIRDNGCDLGVEGYEIHDKIIIHHMNPMTVNDISHGNDDILNPNYLISVSHKTHNAIHYGDENQLPKEYVPRRPGDTQLWPKRQISRRDHAF